MADLKIHCITYNVQGAEPDQDLLALLDIHVPVDIYVIALQEVDMDKDKPVADEFVKDPWSRKFLGMLAENHTRIETSQIRDIGVVLSIFVKNMHIPNINEVKVWNDNRTTAIRFQIFHTTMCFVNSHLSPHDHQLNARIKEYNNAINAQAFGTSGCEKILDHDCVFWMGDLNFRLNEEFGKTPEQINQLIDDDQLVELFQHDQLQKVKSEKQAFSDLMEEVPKFSPTFKFIVGENQYDYKRRPAWCDRILYKFDADSAGLHLEQTSYDSHPELQLSDHKPVTADFEIGMKMI